MLKVIFSLIHWLDFFQYNNYEVKYVQNITDVGHLVGDAESGEDKIQKKAKSENMDPYEVAQKYENIYFDTMSKLNIRRPSISCRATGHIIEIQEMIKTLIGNGNAYITEEGNVYFDVSSYKDYGKLSNRDIDNNLSGGRVEIFKDKRNPNDFALWKKDTDDHLMKWDSPWGVGFPGWHIECSAMAKKYLGDTFDIHGGGIDNIFPHHECEIAQSESANKCKFVNYFIHNNLVTVNGKKMGKSLGNYVTLTDLFDDYAPDFIRFYIISSHYRKPIDFNDQSLKELYIWYEKITEMLSNVNKGSYNEVYDEKIKSLKDGFIDCLNDDMNTANAISILYEVYKIYSKNKDNLSILFSIKDFFDNEVRSILGVKFDLEDNSKNSDNKEFISLIGDIRILLRESKQFELSDRIRDLCNKKGIEFNDKKL